MITNADLLICKAITTESFPDRGWVGIVVPDPANNGVILVDVMNRAQMYSHIKGLMKKHGESVVLCAASAFRVPPGHQLIFTKYGEAFDINEARKIIERHLVTHGK